MKLQKNISDSSNVGHPSITHTQYQNLWDVDQHPKYPASHFALRKILTSLHEQGAERLLEIGVGHGRAAAILTSTGLDFFGIDNDVNMVEASSRAMSDLGLPEANISWGDIEDSISLVEIHRSGPFDALLAMGVLPVLGHERIALQNMLGLVKPGGKVFVECRNKLFSLVTFNRHTYDFIMDDLLGQVAPSLRDVTGAFLHTRVDMDSPPKPSGQAIKSHNPLDVRRIFEQAGFIDIAIKPFHYHAAPPHLEKELGDAFRAESIALENDPSDWRGLFLCSAFIVEARRPA